MPVVVSANGIVLFDSSLQNAVPYPFVLRYEEIGDMLYQNITIALGGTGSVATIIETYTEERPTDQ